MLLNVDFGVIVEDFIERVSGFAVSWWCDERAILRILIGSPRQEVLLQKNLMKSEETK